MRGPLVVFDAVDVLSRTIKFHFSHIADYIYDFCPLPDPDVRISILVCEVDHTSFHFGLCGRKFVLCQFPGISTIYVIAGSIQELYTCLFRLMGLLLLKIGSRSISLCLAYAALFVHVFQDCYVHVLYSLFLQSQMHSRKPRTQRRVVDPCVVFASLLFELVYGMYFVICRRVLAPACFLG